jgi:hypothetical protein
MPIRSISLPNRQSTTGLWMTTYSTGIGKSIPETRLIAHKYRAGMRYAQRINFAGTRRYLADSKVDNYIFRWQAANREVQL